MAIIKAFSWLTLILMVSSQKKNSDIYEFGFTIDGEQHRHEKKDVNGIIQGEFGFITADGIYHVTVYATDENGNFKILSMRNIRISAPLDGSPLPKGAKIESYPGVKVNTSKQNNVVQSQEIVATTTTKKTYRFTTQPTIKPACGGCGYVTTSKPKPGGLPPLQNPPPTSQINHQNAFLNPQSTATPQNAQEASLGNNPTPDSQILVQDPSTVPENSPNLQHYSKPATSEKHLIPNSPKLIPSISQNSNSPNLQNIPTSDTNSPILVSNNAKNPGSNFQNAPFNTNNQNPDVEVISPQQQLNPRPSPLAQVSVSNSAIHVPGNPDIPIRDKYPGMMDGLPVGITERDITDILYKFNYTVGFHGHYEKGLKNGAKIGGYFVTGRDGISMIVTYVADENGYRPKVKFVRLDLNSDDVPKEGTEKSFGLKNFEFVWYPIN